MSNGIDMPPKGSHVPLDSTARQLVDELGETIDRKNAGDLTWRGARNKRGESIGEYGTRRYAERTFHGRIISETPIPTRGQGGAPMLDVVYELDNGDFVVLESKYNTSKMGKVNRNVIQMGDTGPESIAVKNLKEAKDATIRIDKKAVDQFAPEWFQDRVREIRKQNPRLAARLERAWAKGKIHAHVIRVNEHGFGTLEADLSERWRVFKQRAIPAEPTRTPNLGKNTTSGALDVNRPGGITNVERGLESAERGVVKEVETVAARRGESLVARQGVEKAMRSAAIRGAARVAGRAALAVGRVLITVISRVIAILDAVGIIMFAVEIVSMLWDQFRDKAMNEAIEKAMKTHLPGDISASLEKHQEEIARYFARAWLKKRNLDPTFLFLSPRLTVTGIYGKNGFDFDVQLVVESIAKDLVVVSVKPLEPSRDESERGPYNYHFEIRWSAQQPIYTPFDIYRSFTEFFAEHVVDSWVAHYESGRKLSPDVVNQFHSVVQTLAHISATLKYEPWFGWDSEDQRFSLYKAAGERWEALQKLSATIDKTLIPAVSRSNPSTSSTPGSYAGMLFGLRCVRS